MGRGIWGEGRAPHSRGDVSSQALLETAPLLWQRGGLPCQARRSPPSLW